MSRRDTVCAVQTEARGPQQRSKAPRDARQTQAALPSSQWRNWLVLLSLCRITGTDAVLPSFAPRAATDPRLLLPLVASPVVLMLPSLLLACILDALSSCAWETPRGPTTVLAMQ